MRILSLTYLFIMRTILIIDSVNSLKFLGFPNKLNNNNPLMKKYIISESNMNNEINIHTKETFDSTWLNHLKFLNSDIYFNKDKKLITITPGGLKGFYVLGICSYIKQNYNLKEYIFSGASAGSWNSLIMSYKHNDNKLIDSIFDIEFEKADSIFNVELMIKDKILTDFSNNDFSLDKIYIGSTIFDKCKLKSIVYNNFDSLSDAIDCCIGSSHIPIISGKTIYIYRNKFTLDGGFSLFFNQTPYLPTIIPSLIINPNLFKNDEEIESMDLCDLYKGYIDSLDITKIVNAKKMFEEGYNNAKENKNELDQIFL